MRRIASALLLAVLFASFPVPTGRAAAVTREIELSPPIDALSVGGADIDVSVSGFDGSSWTPAEDLRPEDEQDPLSGESNLIIFPHPVSAVRLSGKTLNVTLHPIRVSHTPAETRTASLVAVSQPRILSRNDWGADDSLLAVDGDGAANGNGDSDKQATASSAASTASLPQRVRDCLEAQRLYPDEFKMGRRVTTDGQGRTLRWPWDYSPSVRLLVVHHTAQEIGTDERPAVERMRALYQYHSVNRGWGDIGYHYVVDENGQVYQGKAGGEAVVGGHAYCANIGTIGIALMGNFEVEQPTQAQMKSLQWLLDTVADQYGIDVRRSVIYHGKTLSAVVGHRELVSTTCPGYYVKNTLDQVRSHLLAGTLDASITFPPPPQSSSARASSSSRAPQEKSGLTALGDTTLTVRPGGEVTVALQYRAAASTVKKRRTLGTIRRSNPRIGVWVAQGEAFIRSRTSLSSPQDIAPHQTVTLRVKIQVPRERGVFTLRLGDLTFTLQTEGKSIRLPGASSASRQTYYPPSRSASSASQELGTRDSDFGAGNSQSSSLRPRSEVRGPSLRIRLTKRETGATDCSAYDLPAIGRNYRGTVSCTMVDGFAALINVLTLEDYISGLSEEPDTEPFEKQKSFAVAARTYAAYYSDSAHRKFPGKPYDGSDDPAIFQAYAGIAFEKANPRWTQAALETANQVLMKNGQVLRPPYFSSDDGRTRSPAEVGWNNFPFAEVFTSKPDPWCNGMELRGHGVGMSGCGARGQAYEGRKYLEILRYYYFGATVERMQNLK